MRATQVITMLVKKLRPHTCRGSLSVTLIGAEMCLPFTQLGWQVLTVPVPVPTAWVLDHVQVIDSKKNDESADTATFLGSKTGEAADHPFAAMYTLGAGVFGAGVDGRADADSRRVAVACPALDAHAAEPMLAATATANRATTRTCIMSSLFDRPGRPIRSGRRRRQVAGRGRRGRRGWRAESPVVVVRTSDCHVVECRV